MPARGLYSNHGQCGTGLARPVSAPSGHDTPDIDVGHLAGSVGREGLLRRWLFLVELDFEGLPGVEDVVSGFTGGTARSPTYNDDHTGHYEAVEITYDPSIASYQDLLDHYWVNIDPFDATGQFCDKGPSYRAAIFVSTPEESRLAEQSKQDVQAMFPDQRVVTKILDACGALSRCRGTCWCWLTRTGRPLPPSCTCR